MPDNDMTSRTCPICPVCSSTIGPVPMTLEKGGFRSYNCPSCRVVFSCPMKAASPEWYETTYGKTDLRPSMYAGRKHTWECDEFHKSSPVKKGTLLEIGCGEGAFLDHAQTSGFDAAGIDINHEAVKKAKSGGFNAHCMTTDDMLRRFPMHSFDIICFYHLLEHLENPRGFMSDVNKLLKHPGHIIFSVPNPERIGCIFGRENWDYPPHHLTSWNRHSLEVLLKTTGFEILSFKDEPLRFMKELPVNLSGKIRSGINKKIEAAHSRAKSNFTKTPLRIMYQFLSLCKKYLSRCSILLSLPWYFFKYRHRKGGSLLIIAKKKPA